MYFSIDFGRKREHRNSIENPSTPLSRVTDWLTDLFGGSTSAGVNVSEETALTFSAVYGCVRIISETLASFPAYVYKWVGQGKEIDFSHPLFPLVHDEASPIHTSYELRELVQASALLWGNGYAKIIRDSNYRPIALDFIPPSKVEPFVSKVAPGIYYKIQDTGEIIPQRDMIHIHGISFDGISGKSPIQVAKENIGLALAMERFGGDFFLNNASFGGTLSHPGKLSPNARKNLEESLIKKYTGEGNRFKSLILEEGMKFDAIGIPPEQAQWLSSRKFQIEEISRVFGVPLHLLSSLDRSTNNNIEAQGVEFVTHTMRPWAIRWESELNRKLFREQEKGKYFTRLNMNALLRGDSASRATYFGKMVEDGIMTRNEVRLLEDLNPLPGLDEPLTPSNLTGTVTPLK